MTPAEKVQMMDDPQDKINSDQGHTNDLQEEVNKSNFQSTELQAYINREFKQTLDDHEKHLQIANHEMGAVKVTLEHHDTLLMSILEEMKSMKAIQWAIVCGIGATLLGVIGVLFEVILKHKLY